MSDFDPGEGWRNVQFEDKVPNGTVAFREDDGSWSYWVREAPMPTAPYTVIRAHWGTSADMVLILDPRDGWRSKLGSIYSPDDIASIDRFEVLSEPRALTAKAVLDRVHHRTVNDDFRRQVAREFGVTDE